MSLTLHSFHFTHGRFIGHSAFGPELLPTRSLLSIFIKPNGDDKAPIDLRQRLLETALAWIEDVDDSALHTVISAAEVSAVSFQAGRAAKGLSFGTLQLLALRKGRAFGRLMRLMDFFPAISSMEGLLKVSKCVSAWCFLAHCVRGIA